MAATVSAPSKGGEYLTFRLGENQYGIDILRVQEIRGYKAPTYLVRRAPWLLGVSNVRGLFIPIIDLRLKFGLADASYDHLTVVIILDVRGRTIGVVVDSVAEVLEFSDDQVRAVKEFSDSDWVRLVKHVAAIDKRAILVVDIEALMTEDDMKLLSGA